MSFKNHIILVFLLILLGNTCLFSLEIPLTHGAGKKGITVGYVDMEKIFHDYPETQKAKNEYYVELAKVRKNLSEREKELAELKEQLTVLRATLVEVDKGTSTMSDVEPSPSLQQETSDIAHSIADMGVSSASVAAVKESLVQREQILMQEEADFEQARIEAVQELRDLEKQRSLKILGKLYKALVQLAEEKGIGLVVDKSSILFGQEAYDMTESLARRIRGLPDEQ